MTAVLRWRIPPVVDTPGFPGANEPCRKHAFAITSYELRLTLGYLTTSSVAREAMAASSSSVIDGALPPAPESRFLWRGISPGSSTASMF